MRKQTHDYVTIEPLRAPKELSVIPEASLSSIFVEIEEYKKDCKRSFHFEHDCFTYTYAGICTITVDGVPYTMHPGDAMILRGGSDWNYTVECKNGLCRTLSVNFRGEITDALLRGYGLSATALYPDCGCSPFARLLEAFLCREEENLDTLEDEVLQLLLSIFQRLARRHVGLATALSSRAKQFITTYACHGDMQISFIAKTLRCNPTKLQKQFRESYGISIRRFIIEKRLEQAKHLLLSTSLPISEIAASIGYSGRKYLDSLFMKCEGMTASAYRKSGGSKGQSSSGDA